MPSAPIRAGWRAAMTPNAPRPDAMAIAVFAKAPVAGAVKTRLAPILGNEGAAKLHADLTRRALSAAVASGVGAVELWCAPDAADPFFARCAREFGATLVAQGNGDLGERMARAFAAAHGRGASLIVIGADIPGLDAGMLRSAAAALRSHDAVIAPAED